MVSNSLIKKLRMLIEHRLRIVEGGCQYDIVARTWTNGEEEKYQLWMKFQFPVGFRQKSSAADC